MKNFHVVRIFCNGFIGKLSPVFQQGNLVQLGIACHQGVL